MLIGTYYLWGRGNALSGRRYRVSTYSDPVSSVRYSVPASDDRMSACANSLPGRADNMLWHRYSCMPDYDLPVDAYSVYSSKDGLSPGSDSVPDSRYQVSTCFDQMSA
jgi:hypothetical protein